MKRKFKSIVALIAAAIMVFSVIGTVSADDTQADWVVFARNRDYNANMYGLANWNTNNAVKANSTDDRCPDGTDVYYISLAASTIAATPNTSTSTGNYTAVDEYKYYCVPLRTASTGSTLTKKSFSEYVDVEALSNADISIEMAKGTSYDANYYSSFKLGLAYIDFNTTETIKLNGNKVYPTGFSWLDITDDVKACGKLTTKTTETRSWAEVSGEISVSVADVIASSETKYIHGATAATHAVTVENANAIVVCIETPSATTEKSGEFLVWDNLRFVRGVSAPAETSFALTGSVAEGITLTATNAEESAITPIVITAYYKGNTLVAAVPNNELTIGAGATASEIYEVDASYDYDKVKVIVIDAYDSIKPLCVNFEE